MSITADDLAAQPRQITITRNNKEYMLTAQPVRMSHALLLTKAGKIFENASDASENDIDQAEKIFTRLINELIPELKGVDLDLQVTLDIISALMDTVEPTDNKELNEAGVKFDDPKADKSGGGST